MANKYGTVVTNAGNALITNCILAGSKLVISEAAAGDGGGEYYEPTVNQTALKNECWRGEITSAQINADTPNMLDVKIVIPDDVGGFFVREMGLYSESGELIAVCNHPATEKVAISTGVSGKLTMIMHILVADASVVEFVIKPSLDAITSAELGAAVNEHNEAETAHPELRKQLTDLDEKTTFLEADMAKRTVKMYASLEEIGLTAGEETIEAIAQALGENCELFYATGDNNAKIYPGIYGIAHVICVDADHVKFQWTDRSTGTEYGGVYCAANSTKWVGWMKVGSDITLDSLGAVAKAGDTMIGALYAGVQTPGEYLVRNQKLSATEETLIFEGAICWVYR